MTELPPIIERLDAALERPDVWGSPPDAWRTLIENLRTELLQLQEERDYWQGLVVYADENGAFPHGEILQLTIQRDALLEALKAVNERTADQQMAYTCVDCGCEAIFHREEFEQRPCERCQQCRVPVPYVIAQAAIASVEGKDG